jgi:hypothetical protein
MISFTGRLLRGYLQKPDKRGADSAEFLSDVSQIFRDVLQGKCRSAVSDSFLYLVLAPGNGHSSGKIYHNFSVSC